MNTKKIVIFSASEQKNLELAGQINQQLSSMDVQTELINILDLELPLYSSRADAKYKVEELLASVLPKISEATALVFVAPEYNGSTPPAFNNFLAWLSRSSKDWREHLNGKHAAIATFSAGGGIHVLSAMRSQLSFIGMNVLGRQIHTTFAKPLEQASLEAVCRELVKFS